jgi:hypothetical protein
VLALFLLLSMVMSLLPLPLPLRLLLQLPMRLLIAVTATVIDIIRTGIPPITVGKLAMARKHPAAVLQSLDNTTKCDIAAMRKMRAIGGGGGGMCW